MNTGENQGKNRRQSATLCQVSSVPLIGFLRGCGRHERRRHPPADETDVSALKLLID